MRITADLLVRLLDRGELGDPILPERQLATLLGVNRLTLRWAMDRLVKTGRVRREQGRGAAMVARPRLWSPGRVAAMNEPVVLLGVDDPARAVGGWPWRVWRTVAERMERAGWRAVAVRAADLDHSALAGRPSVVLGDRTGPIEPAARRVVLGRRSADAVWNVLDVDWSPALAETINRVRPVATDRVLVMFDRAGASLDAQRWYASLLEQWMACAGSAARIATIPGGRSESGAYLAARKHLRDGGRPSVIFADDDLAAAGAVRALRGRELDPSRVRLVGRGGTRVAQYLRPRLTTLTPPIDAIADAALARLTAERDDAPVQVAQLFPARCVARQPAIRRDGRPNTFDY